MYHLQFSGENIGTYVKYSDYISEIDVTTGPFQFKNLSATSTFAFQDYDNFENSEMLILPSGKPHIFLEVASPGLSMIGHTQGAKWSAFGQSYTGSELNKLPESALVPSGIVFLMIRKEKEIRNCDLR